MLKYELLQLVVHTMSPRYVLLSILLNLKAVKGNPKETINTQQIRIVFLNGHEYFRFLIPMSIFHELDFCFRDE